MAEATTLTFACPCGESHPLTAGFLVSAVAPDRRPHGSHRDGTIVSLVVCAAFAAELVDRVNAST